MRPIFWKWVGIGMLAALGIAWLTEYQLATHMPGSGGFLGQTGMASGHGPIRRGRFGPPFERGRDPRQATATVIIRRANGSTQRVTVGAGQTVVVGSDGATHVVNNASTPRLGPERDSRANWSAKMQAAAAASMAKADAARIDAALKAQIAGRQSEADAHTAALAALGRPSHAQSTGVGAPPANGTSAATSMQAPDQGSGTNGIGFPKGPPFPPGSSR